MSLVIENGSGVFGANSYVASSFVTAYLTDRNRETENLWSTAGATAQDAACVEGTDYVEIKFSQLFKGRKEFRDISLARSTLTLTAIPLEGDQVVVGTVTYTATATLSSANDVLIATSVAGFLTNLFDAINATETAAGVGYEATTVVNPDGSAFNFIDDTLVIFSRTVGTAGNLVVTTTNITGASWNFATCVGGSDVSRAQPISFPRADLYDRDGNAVIGIPDLLKQAVAEYAVRSVDTSSVLAPDPTVDSLGGDVVRLKEVVGPIETDVSYTPGSASSGKLPSYPAADRLLRDYTQRGGVIRA